MDSKFISEDLAQRETPLLNDADLDEEALWKVIETFFEEYGLIQHQLSSFDEFVETGLRSIFEHNRVLVVEVEAESERKKLQKILNMTKKELETSFKKIDTKNSSKKYPKLQELSLFQKKGSKQLKNFFIKYPCLYIKNGNVMKKYKVEFGEFFLETPIHVEVSGVSKNITPFECRRRNITYNSQLSIDIETTDFNGHVNVHKRVHIGNIPVMVGSCLCNLKPIKHDKDELAKLLEDFYDPGGYFIIKGGLKVIASQEKASVNQICVFKTTKKGPKFTHYAEVRSCAPRGSHSTNAQVGMLKNGRIGVTVPYIDSSIIPLGLMFRALGVTGDCKEMIGYILPDLQDKEAVELLVPSFEYSLECKEQNSALKYIGKKGKKFAGVKKENEDLEVDTRETITNAISYAKHLLYTEFLPHLGSGSKSLIKKRFYLGYMVRKLLWVILKRGAIQDRDHFANKRITTAGELLSQQFVSAFRRLRNEISSGIIKDAQKNSAIKITSKIGPKIITNALSSALSDNSGLRGKTQGASQKFDQFNYSDSLSNLRKLVTPINQDSGGKIDLPRKLHNSQWMTCCAAETPEGKKVGLVKQLALSCLITVGSPPDSILELLKLMKVIPFEEVASRKGNLLSLDKILVNGDLVGVTHFPEEIVKDLRILRRSGDLNPEISVSYDKGQGEVVILTEAGRTFRPLLVVEKGRPLLKKSHIQKIVSGEWDDPSAWINLLSQGFVEMIDKTEEENLLIAYSPRDLDGMNVITRLKYTHCELHPCLMYGVGASTIPFPQCNQSPRNSYQASMGKQAVAIPGANYQFLTHGKFCALQYPEIPLVSSRASKIIGFHNLPSSQNVVVAVCPWEGYGQEDSIIMNQDSIDRGLLNITSYFSFEAKVNRRRNQEQFEVPKEYEVNRFKGNTSKLIEEVVENIGSEKVFCFAPEGTKVENGDVIIGKTVVEDGTVTIHRKKKTDNSVVYNHIHPGTIHSVIRGVDGNGYDYIRVVVAQVRPPICADKFCFSPDHEVLTENGWISVTQIAKDIRIASLDQGKLVYEYPTHVVSFEAPKEMVEINSNQVSFCVTPNHNMYIKKRGKKDFELARVDTLFNRHVHYKKNAIWDAPGLSEFVLPRVEWERSKNTIYVYEERHLPIKPWLSFFGIWIAEGWVRKGRIGVAVHKQRVLSVLKDTLNEMGVKFSLDSEENYLRLYDKQLAEYMMEFRGGALTKFLPEWTWQLNQKQCRILLEAMLLGDGHMNGTTPIYDTSSLRLKDDTMRLALHCGWGANAFIRYPKGRHKTIRGKDTVTYADLWRITIVKKQLTPAVNKHIKGQQKWVQSPSDRVYCCTVPSGLLYVRRVFKDKKISQRPAWVGNSATHGDLKRLAIVESKILASQRRAGNTSKLREPPEAQCTNSIFERDRGPRGKLEGNVIIIEYRQIRSQAPKFYTSEIWRRFNDLMVVGWLF